MRFRAILICLLAAAPSLLRAQNYPDIHWRTIQTEHAYIHYYDAVEWTARKVAVVFEEIYPKVTGIYGHEPSRPTHVVVRDDQDKSNGFAVANIGWITIWTSPSSLPLRGRSDWIREVITHEFAHIVSLQAASPAGGLVEGLRFGLVLGGGTDTNHNIGASAFVLSNPYPRWWAEGTAQLDDEAVGYDFWDTHRDMLLRAAVLEDNLLSFNQMRNITVREYLGGEMVYNQGFAFLRWLKETYGRDANLSIARESADQYHIDFDRNLADAFHKSAQELYTEWKEHLIETYTAQTAEIRKSPLEGERIPLVSPAILDQTDPPDRPYKDGTFNFAPRFSPDGRWFSWTSDRNLKLRRLANPFDLSELGRSEEKEKGRPAGLSLSFEGSFHTWSPDSRTILLSRRLGDVIGGYPYFDLYRIDLKKLVDVREAYESAFRASSDPTERRKLTRRYDWKKRGFSVRPKRITHKLRATYVAWSPDGTEIAYTQSRDGGRNLRILDPESGRTRDLVAIGGDAEATEPAWSPDGTSIAFTLFNHGQADIWFVPRSGGTPRPLTLDAADDRDPAFTPDGKFVIFSSDRSGIFQLYALPANAAQGTQPTQLTRLETGAFEPYPAADGKTLLYSRFSSFGFKPYRIEYVPPAVSSPDPAPAVAEDQAQAQLTRNEFPETKSRGYFPWPRPVRLFPSMVFENDQFKAGVALQVSDYLEKHNLTALALFGRDQDYQVSYENRMFYPTLDVTYTAYIRNNLLQFINDGDTSLDEPNGIVRDAIQFIDAGLSQNFEVRRALPGSHKLSLWYHRRFVDRRIGFPLFIGDQIETTFRLLTNDQVELNWAYASRVSSTSPDFDINPRDVTKVSLSYILDHTRLATPDSTIPSPNQGYFYHKGFLKVERYIALPWPAPWWNQHTLWFRFNGGVISRRVNINDDFFLGGRLDFRAFGQISQDTLFYGYAPFSIFGETMLLLSTGYTFPIARRMDYKKSLLYVDGLYGTFFTEVGNSWTFGEVRNLFQNATRDSTLGQGTVLLVDSGWELRLKAFLFSDSNPWNSVFRIAYGFQDDAKHGFSGTDWPVHLYLGIGTDF
ncbi:MAG: hypothetical protein V1798_02330 [Pseudomonadota bacterium]